MSFTIMVDKAVEKQVQKIVKTQIQKAIVESKHEDIETDKAVHQIRKRCKKLRGLLRMIRPILKDKKLYDEKNRAFKEIASGLSGARDSKVLGDTYAKIVKRYGLDWQKYEEIASSIDAIKSETMSDEEIESMLTQTRQELHSHLGDIHRYKIKHTQDILDKGVQKGYKKARNLQNEAARSLKSGEFHQWRKWVKYHWYQMQMLQKNSGCLLNARVNRLKLLADVLGEEHDITVFKEYLHKESLAYEEEFVSYLDKEQGYLRKVAFEMGEELFCASPKRFVKFLNAIFQL